MLEGFRHGTADLGEARIRYAVGGSGPPLLLLHGYPQTHAMWHKVAPRLAERFTVVASDLRGYGDSVGPPTTPDHAPYTKRAVAADQVALMASLGFHAFHLAGHDRGGRVAHRLALDHPEAVSKLAVLDIAPTHAMYTGADMAFATAYYHWFFFIQPHPLPETLIGAAPAFFLRWKLGAWGSDPAAFTEAALHEYERCFTPEVIHSSCEDYRASASTDLRHDEADLAAGVRLRCPLLVLWGARGFVGRAYDPVAEWRAWADDVRGVALPCGHFLPEEAPEETLEALLSFFQGE